jgi:hypothetical protein
MKRNRPNLWRMNPKSQKSQTNNYPKRKTRMNSCFLNWIRYRMKKTLKDWMNRMRNLNRFPYFSSMVLNSYPD